MKQPSVKSIIILILALLSICLPLYLLKVALYWTSYGMIHAGEFLYNQYKRVQEFFKLKGKRIFVYSMMQDGFSEEEALAELRNN